MFVKHLQEYLDQFTNGKKGNAISNARVYMQVGGHLEEVRRIEVQESGVPDKLRFSSRIQDILGIDFLIFSYNFRSGFKVTRAF